MGADEARAARHAQPCRNATWLSFSELHDLAGKYDAYPTTQPCTPDACPTCGSPDLPPLALYCSAECRREAQKRALAGVFQRRNEPEPEYSYAPPTK